MGRVGAVCYAEVIKYTDEGQQGKCMRPGEVRGTIVDRLTEQAEKQWEKQDHPGWDIFEDDGACEALPVGPTGVRVQLIPHSSYFSVTSVLLSDRQVHL